MMKNRICFEISKENLRYRIKAEFQENLKKTLSWLKCIKEGFSQHILAWFVLICRCKSISINCIKDESKCCCWCRGCHLDRGTFEADMDEDCVYFLTWTSSNTKKVKIPKEISRKGSFPEYF